MFKITTKTTCTVTTGDKIETVENCEMMEKVEE